MTDEVDVIRKQELLKDSGQAADDVAGLVFTHVNVRKSILLLLAKLVTIELIAIVSGVVFLLALENFRNIEQVAAAIAINPYIFGFFAVIKLAITIYVVLEWYEEYYEISGNAVAHFKGDIFKRQEVVKLQHIASIKLEQSFWGRLFNFGTIRLHSWFLNKDYFLYQIHNPKKYEGLLAKLMPRADRMKKILREHVIEEEDENQRSLMKV